MARVKDERPEMSAFERKRLENMAANQAMLKDLSTAAAKIIPKPAPKPVSKPKKRSAPVKREAPIPTRTSSRIKGIEADSETHKRKAEEEYEVARQMDRIKRQRVAGDLDMNGVMVEKGAWKKDDGFLAGVMRGARPYERTFGEEDVKETTDQSLKRLREKVSGLELYETWEPNQIKICPERIYSLGFHPTADKALIFAGDKLGNLGIFDASQTGDVVKAEDNDDDEVDAELPEPAISAFKVHSRTISSFLFSEDGDHIYSGSYDSSVRKMDLQKGTAIEVYAPASLDDDEPISTIAIPANDPNILYFATLNGQFGKHDMRTKSNTDIMTLSDKKVGGFSLHPLQPHLMASGSIDRTLKLWDLRKITGKGDNRHPTLIGEHTSRLSVSHAAWSAGGHVATSGYDDTIKIYDFSTAATWKIGHDIIEPDMEPSSIIKHNNQTGRWVTVLKPQWQQRPDDGIQKFVMGNMNRFVDVYSSTGEQLAQLGGDGITAVPAVAQFHPTRDWVAGGTGSGKLCLWM